jgi:hypothetical protein
MKSAARIAPFVFAVAMLFAPAALTAQGYGQPGYGQPGYGRPPGPAWDAPPSSYRQDLQRSAYRDGINGAGKDQQNRRRPDVNNRDEYRNYRGPHPKTYRDAFLAGYRAYWRHAGVRY